METNSTQTVAVDRNYYWLPIERSTPNGVKFQLINRNAGVATYGVLTEENRKFFDHYAPLPAFRPKVDAPAPITSGRLAWLITDCSQLVGPYRTDEVVSRFTVTGGPELSAVPEDRYPHLYDALVLLFTRG